MIRNEEQPTQQEKPSGNHHQLLRIIMMLSSSVTDKDINKIKIQVDKLEVFDWGEKTNHKVEIICNLLNDQLFGDAKLLILRLIKELSLPLTPF